jgi:hypothetical protein
MPRDISSFLMMLRREGPLTPGILLDMVHELSEGIRHGHVVIRSLHELDELANVLALVSRGSEIPPHYVERLFSDLMISIDQALPPPLAERARLILRRGLERHLGHPLVEEEALKKKKKEKEEQEKLEKVFQSIKSIKLDEADRVLFFVGAGASKPSPSNIPTVDELLPELWKKSSRMETKPLQKLETWCGENGIENIEEMLTAVTISDFIIKSPKVHGPLSSVLYPEWKGLKEVPIRDIDSVLLLGNMLNTFFSLPVGTMLQAKPNTIHKAIAGYAKERKNVDILTTNYDSCVDQALDELGVKYNYVFNMGETANSLSLVKMHGSINWFYCDTRQSVFLPPIETVAEGIKRGYAVSSHWDVSALQCTSQSIHHPTRCPQILDTSTNCSGVGPLQKDLGTSEGSCDCRLFFCGCR